MLEYLLSRLFMVEIASQLSILKSCGFGWADTDRGFMTVEYKWY